MKQKKRIFVSLLLMGTTLMAHAGERDCLLVHMTSGSTVAFPLSEVPVITFDGGVVTIATSNYLVSNVKKYTFGDLSSNISNVNNDVAVKGEYSADGRFFCVRLNDASVPLRLYTAGGVEVPLNMKCDINGMVLIDLGKLSREVYLLTVGNETIKIRRQ